jgi:3-phosphoglycerate kinase
VNVEYTTDACQTCKRPRALSAEERTLLFVYCRDHWVAKCATCASSFRLQELASDLAPTLLDRRVHLCPGCRSDLTDSVRAHLQGCVILPDEIRLRMMAARETAQKLVKQSHQLSDRADVLMREAEAALHALRETMRQPPRKRSV